MEYKIINNSCLETLHLGVNNFIENGFEPLGGIFANKDKDGDEWFYQAMIRRDKEPERCEISGVKLGPTTEETKAVEPKPLQIEVGKFYRNRNGCRAYIFNENNDGESEITFDFCVDLHSTTLTARQNGRCFIECETPADLIEEWRD